MLMETDKYTFNVRKYVNQTCHSAPLATFRLLFGFLMVISIIRFWYKGWIEKLYLDPTFHFHYYGFEWVNVPADGWCYFLFIICGLSALFFAIGWKYHISIIIFFLSFTYIELMDKTTYLNHYYFVSVVSFILIFLPAERYFSVDSYLKPGTIAQYIPKWNVDIIKLMLAIVYFYAGLAKLNYDWLIEAKPLAIWLPSKFDIPLLGDWVNEKWMHYVFSWGGTIYDLTIPFLLFIRRTRLFAFGMVLIFHILTRVLFPIGMFPYIMILATLVFFDTEFHNWILEGISKIFGIAKAKFDNGIQLLHATSTRSKVALRVLCFLIVFQLLFPWRFLAYPGNLYWTEQGYRFSWRVMLMEKTGYANFKIVNGKTGKRFYVQNEDFLTAFQQKQMSTQADFIVEYAHYLGNHFESQGHQNVEVYVESYASLNGRKSQEYINPEIDLMKVKINLKNKEYILPLHD